MVNIFKGRVRHAKIVEATILEETIKHEFLKGEWYTLPASKMKLYQVFSALNIQLY